MENLISKIQVGGTDYGVVPPAGLTEEQQAQARQNIGAISSAEADVVRDGTYPDMTVGEATHAQNADAAINATTAANATNAANSAQTAKLQTAQLIDGVEFDGTAQVAHYGVCSTAAGTAAKTVSLSGFALVAGARITVNFTMSNTVSSPTLNVNGTGAVAMKCKTRTTGLAWQPEIMTLVYDGTNWCIVGGYSLADKPVGSHQIQHDGESTPAALYGGTWAIDTDYTGRVPVGSGTGFDLGATGGSADAIIIEHRHLWDYPVPTGGGFSKPQSSFKNVFDASGYTNEWDNCTTQGVTDNNPALVSSGEGKNMQPYKVVGVWKRTA